MWWSIPNWSRLLPVLGGALLAPMALVPVSTPPTSEHAPDIALAPVPPVKPVSPTDPLAPVGPIGQVAVAGQHSPIAPSTAGSTAPAAQTTAQTTASSTSTTPTGSTTATPPSEPATPAAVPQPRLNETSVSPAQSSFVESGQSCPDSGKAGAHLAGSPGKCAVVHELSLDGMGA